MSFHPFDAAQTSVPFARFAYWSAIATSIFIAVKPIDACAKFAAALSPGKNITYVAEPEQLGADFQQLLLNWQKCFTKENVTAQNAAPIIEACDRASVFSALEPNERERLTRRRAKLLEALDHTAETKSGGDSENGASRREGR